MRSLAYNNINTRFTYNNVWTILTKFWLNEVLNQKSYSKIWLTLIVYNSNNKSFTLINNLPFNINNYTDILIVLKQVFNTNLYKDNDILNTVVFKYHLEGKDNYKRDLKITQVYLSISILIIILLLLICIFIVYISIYSTYNIEHIDKETLNFACENLKIFNNKELNLNPSKQCIFRPFIDLFSVNTVVPSGFIDKNLDELEVFKPLFNYNETKAEINTNSYTDLLLKLNKRLVSHENLVDDLLKMVEKNPLK